MTVPYATRADVYRLGLSAQAFVVRARPVPLTDVSATTATIRLQAHGMSTGDAFTFEVTSGGTLPTGITAFLPYYAVVVTADLFRVSLTSGGSAIASWASPGTGGVSPWSISVDQGSRLDAHILDASSAVDECLTAQAPPLLVSPVTGTYPLVVVGIVSRMAARSAVTSLQIENPQYRVAVDRLFAQEAADQQTLTDWKAGKPIQPAAVDQTPGSPFDGPQVGYSQCAQPWNTPYL